MPLVVPGVSVETRFDVLPPLPATSGIVGVAGIVDRSGGRLVGATRASELRDLLGPGTEVSMPEAVHALATGASEVVVAPVSGGSAAFVDLNNDDSQPAVRLRARSNGTWAHQVFADVSETRDATNNVVRVTLRLLRGGREVETFSDLQVKLGAVDDLFDVVNRTSRYVVAVDPGNAGSLPAAGTSAFDAAGTPIDVLVGGGPKPLLRFTPAAGASPAGLSFKLTVDADKIDVQVFQRGLQEHFADLSMDPDDANYLPFLLAAQSRLLRVRTHPSRDAGRQLPRATSEPQALASGTSPSVAAWQTAIDLLADDTRIDLVLAAVEPTAARTDVLSIHEALLAHAVGAADDGAPRIAFGAITPGEQDAQGNDADEVREHASRVRNRRFVLVAPTGAAGIVAGSIGRLNPQDSPTFKPIPLLGLEPAHYRASELNRLLGPAVNLAVVQERVGRGVVLLRGLNTFGDQISVQRVADQCIRETKAIAENFIGELNTDDARIALREQIVATFTRLQRAGALVPSTDGSDPAFVVDVYSTQQDFAQGIVRIDIAVRPVRAIDYVYATIRVKN
jgi:hypothetical protein